MPASYKRKAMSSLRTGQGGFTLLELMIVIVIVSSMAVADLVRMIDASRQQKARMDGIQIATYNNAVGRWLDEFGHDSSVFGTKTGTSWLKSTECGGEVEPSKAVLSCSFPDQTTHFRLTFETVISAADGSHVQAQTDFPPLQLKGEDAPDLAGIAAMAAAGSAQSMSHQAGASYTLIEAGTPPAPTAQIRAIATTKPNDDRWLLVSGSNKMLGSIEFEETKPDYLRNIVNVNRIMPFGAGTLFLGSDTDPSDLVQIDADLVVEGDVTAEHMVAKSYFDSDDMSRFVDPSETSVLTSIQAYGSTWVHDDITSEQGNILAKNGSIESVTGNVIAGNDVIARNDIIADGNIMAFDGSVTARLFYDADDTNYYLDPSNESQLNYIGATVLRAPSAGQDLNIWGDGITFRGHSGSDYANLQGTVRIEDLMVRLNNGRDVPIRELMPTFVHKESFHFVGKADIPEPAGCTAAGGTPRVMVRTMLQRFNIYDIQRGNTQNDNAWLTRGSGIFGAYARKTPDGWTVYAQATPGNSASANRFDGHGLAETYCYYP